MFFSHSLQEREADLYWSLKKELFWKEFLFFFRVHMVYSESTAQRCLIQKTILKNFTRSQECTKSFCALLISKLLLNCYCTSATRRCTVEKSCSCTVYMVDDFSVIIKWRNTQTISTWIYPQYQLIWLENKLTLTACLFFVRSTLDDREIFSCSSLPEKCPY